MANPNLMRGYQIIAALKAQQVTVNLQDIQTFLYGSEDDIQTLLAMRYPAYTWGESRKQHYPARLPSATPTPARSFLPGILLYANEKDAWFMLCDGRIFRTQQPSPESEESPYKVEDDRLQVYAFNFRGDVMNLNENGLKIFISIAKELMEKCNMIPTA